jgi:hypothetical protein
MYKQFKNYILFSILLLPVFTSCKKDSTNNNSSNAISVSIDGTPTTFNIEAKAIKESVTGGYGITIQGYKKDPAVSQTNLSFSVVSPDAITAKTYIENTSGNPLIVMTYFLDTTVLGIGITASNYGSTTHPVTITITAITSSTVKGMFSGELSYTDLNGNPAKDVLSNGTFNVNF